MSLLEVRDLTKQYRDTRAVDGISFSVFEGEIFGLIGPNGAGKTTTLECCLGLRRPTSGRVELLGMDPVANRRELYSRVGAQLQETSYQEHITVAEVCRAFSVLYENPVPWHGLLERFSIADRATSQVAKLSGGQKQRLTICLALIPNPAVVFLDELTTGLDPRARREMWEDVRRLRDDGVTIIMTTHFMEEAEYLCDRVGIVHHGRISALDTVENLLDDTSLDHWVSFELEQSNASIFDALGTIEGVRRVEREGDRIRLACDSQQVLAGLVLFMEREGVVYRNVRTKSPGLEDVFLHLTGETQEEVER